MSGQLQIGISPTDRDMLLQGLRYVRSSVLLEMREPSVEDTARRETDLRHIAQLVEQLNGPDKAAAEV